MKYIPVIGLEVHVELKTNSKMFCACSADYFGKEPNSHTCPVCLGLPGALPVPSKTAIDWCVMIGLALNCEVLPFAKFDRKNYFYPDLAKGYQISQYDEPFCLKGNITLSNGKKIGITRVHMEEDTGKLTHGEINGKKVSLIDFNRSGVPLVEIVTEPDFDNAQDVKEYLQKLQQIVRYLDVSNADMEKGDMRLEPNISLRQVTSGKKQETSKLPKYKVEVKNINSFRFVEKAIAYEIKRQTQLLDEGKAPLQETRGWDENKQKTISQRVKEEANDYRYFPEPDIPPIHWTNKQLDILLKSIPELSSKKYTRFKKEYNLSSYDVEILTRTRKIADYFEEAVRVNEKLKIKNEKSIEIKILANWIVNKKVDIEQTLPARLIQTILEKTAVEIIDDSTLRNVIDIVIAEHQKVVDDYKNGKDSAIMFLVGQVMRKVGKKIDARHVRVFLQKAIL